MALNAEQQRLLNDHNPLFHATGLTSALSAAHDSIAVANTALADAATGIGDAAAAQGTANTALADAGTALGDAAAALGTANTALADAGTALGDAATAQAAADLALGRSLPLLRCRFHVDAPLPVCIPAGAGVGKRLTEDPVAAILAVSGVQCVAGDVLLATGQAHPRDNGAYIVTDAGDGITDPWILTRLPQWDTVDAMQHGAMFSISQGVHEGTIWMQVQNLAVLDTDPMGFLRVNATSAERNSIPTQAVIAIGEAAFTEAIANTETIALAGYPVDAVILAHTLYLSSEFSGGAISLATLEIGEGADPDLDCAATNVFTGAGIGNKDTVPTAIGSTGCRRVGAVKSATITCDQPPDTLTAGYAILFVHYLS